MKCRYCGLHLTSDDEACGRCGASASGASREASGALQDGLSCPSCGASNDVRAEYCATCGAPMAVITRVVELAGASEREELQPWRVYGIETRMVGRDEHLDRLWQLHRDTVVDGRARLVHLTGSTGIGKSRLLAAFDRKLARAFSEALLVQTVCRDVASGPLTLFDRLLRERFYLSEGAEAEIAARKMREAIMSVMGGAEAEDAERVARDIGALLGLQLEGEPDEGATSLEPASESGSTRDDRRGFAAMADLLAADAERNPLVLVFDDMQHASEPALALLAHLREALASRPVLFVVSWNHAEVGPKSPLRRLEADAGLKLGRLTDEQVAVYVRDTLGRVETLPELLVDRLVDSAHGNPLAVEETLRMLIAEGVVDTRGRPWTIDESALEEVIFPTTVEEAVSARLATLDERERRVLEMAACVGQDFWPALIGCLARLRDERDGVEVEPWTATGSDAELGATLESLERKDMIRRRDDSSVAGHHELFFKHRIERRALYDEIPRARRRAYHRLIGQWYEARATGAPGRAAAYVAHHYDRGRCTRRAARKFIEAARFARRGYAHRRAIELYTRGISYLGDGDLVLEMEALHDLGSAHDMLGEHGRALGYYRELLRRSWLLGDPAKGGVAHNKMARAHRSLGDFERASEHLERALELFWEADDLRGVASSLDDRGSVRAVRGEHAAARDDYAAALQLRRRSGERRSLALSLHRLGSLELQRGAHDEATDYFTEALELRCEVGDRQGEAETYNNLGVLNLELGARDAAIEYFEAALQIARQIGFRSMECAARNNRAEALLERGDLDEAEAELERARELAERSGDRRALFDILRNLGMVALERSDRGGALSGVGEAIELAEALDSRVLLARGLQSRAEIHAFFVLDSELREESIEEAGRAYRRALELYEEVGHQAQRGLCLIGYGRFLVEQGSSEEGRERLVEAVALLEELEMEASVVEAGELLRAL